MEAKQLVTALLVDDDPASRKRNEADLKDRGYVVTVASDAESALDVAKQSSPSVIFLHMDARGAGRAGLISALRANDNSRHVPIVFLADRSRGRAGLTPVRRDGWQTAASEQQAARHELGNLRELLQLTEREVAAVSSPSPGMALWRVGQRSFVVEHLVSRAERWIVDTEPREQATHLEGQYRGPSVKLVSERSI